MNTKKKVEKCKCCGGDVKVRNPKGYCDHLYYPENCTGMCMPPTHEPSKWERELENLLTKIVRGYLIDDDFESELKQFISTLLAQREKDLIEKIEKNLVNIFPKEGSIKENKDWSTSEREMYEDCLTAIQHYLNSLKEGE